MNILKIGMSAVLVASVGMGLGSAQRSSTDVVAPDRGVVKSSKRTAVTGSEVVGPESPVVDATSPVAWVDPGGQMLEPASFLGDVRHGDVFWAGPDPSLPIRPYEIVRSGESSLGGRWFDLQPIDGSLGHLTVAVRGGYHAARLRAPLPDGTIMDWRFRARGRDIGAYEPVPADLPGCGGGIPFEGPPAPDTARQFLGGDCGGCSSRVIDLGFFYTSRVRMELEAWLEDNGGDPKDAPGIIEADCELEAADLNVAFSNSLVDGGANVVHIQEIEWDEESPSLLDPFSDRSDPIGAQAWAARELYGIDDCILVSQTDGLDPAFSYCGLAWVPSVPSEDASFCNVLYGCFGFDVTSHEVGHNLTLFHACGDGDETFPCDPLPGHPSCCTPCETDTPNHGWRWVGDTGQCWRSIMAYPPGVRTRHFSNPDVIDDGVPTGSPEDSDDGRWADAASVLRETVPIMAGLECEVVAAEGCDLRVEAASLRTFDLFGTSIAAGAERLVVGAPRHDARGLNVGAVFSLVPAGEGLCWVQQGKFVPDRLHEDDRLGESVAIDDPLMVMAAPRAGRWGEEPGPDGEPVEVLIDAGVGEVSVWESSAEFAGYCEAQVIQLDESQAFDWFGHSVDIDAASEVLVVGAPLADVNDNQSGAVYVFRRQADGLFALQDRLEGGNANHRLGWSVAVASHPLVDSICVVAGAPGRGGGRGGIQWRHYEKDDAGGLVEIASGSAEGEGSLSEFGYSVSAADGFVAVGAPGQSAGEGRVTIFTDTGSGLVLDQQIGLVQLGAGDRFGHAVSIGGGRVVVGAPFADRVDGVIEDVGGVAVFERTVSGQWQQGIWRQPLDLRPGDRLGFAVEATSAPVAFAGAPDADDGGIQSGVVYVVAVEVVDCNGNGIDDGIDIYLGTSADVCGDGVPDECQVDDCRSDLNADGVVNGADLGLLFMNWGECPSVDQPCPADFNVDGVVDGEDLGLFCVTWGLLCDPPKP